MRNFLDIFLKANCPICGRSTPNVICQDCDRQITACKSPKFDLADQVSLFSWGNYDGALKRAIAVCKFENHPELAKPLGQKIAIAWDANSIKPLIKSKVVPIPLHPEKLKARGFNQAELLARSFCAHTGLAIAPQLLQRIKNTKPQIATKNRQERQQNLNEAFIATKTSDPVILFDDIYTSGATIKEAIAAMALVKVKVVGIIVLARPQI